MEQILPFDDNLEDAILGALVKYPEEYDKVMPYITATEVFGQQKAQHLWLKIKSMKQKGKHVDLLTVCTGLTKADISNGITKYYVATCAGDTHSLGMTEFYAMKLYEKYLMRKVIFMSKEIQDRASQNYEDVYALVNDAHTLFGEVLIAKPTEAANIDDIVEETLESIRDKTSKLIKTGYSNLDKYAGGLTRGEITIVGGRPGHGKTTVLINLLSKALDNGNKAIFFSRELPNSELLKKIMCLESKQLSYSMVRKNVYDDKELLLVNDVIKVIKEKYKEDKFLMFDNLRDFEMSSSEVKKFKPDIIFDDYIQLITYNGKEDQRRLQIENLCNNYKWLAKETNSVVVLASQLNRGVEHRDKSYKPQLSDLAESGAIEQVAENVFFTHYDYKVKGEAGKGKNVLTISAGKVRYGDTGTVDLGYDGDKCIVYNSIEEMVANDKNEIPF